jgi:sulfur carrier protein ThiS
VYSPHPLMPAVDRETLYVPVIAGETIAAYLERLGLTARMGRRPVVVSIDGYRVPREMWAHCRPRVGKLVHVQAIVHGGGGGGGKNPIATVLTIALMVFAPYIAAGLAGFGATAAGIAAAELSMGFAFKALTVGISLIGGMVINSLFPPPKPQLSQSQGQGYGSESPTYALAGGSNRARPYEPMPVIIGRHRVFPDAGAKPYTEFVGEDQYLYQIFDFGYNDVILGTFKIGDTPLENYTGVDIEQSGVSGVLTLFPGNVDTIAGAALTAAASWITRTSSSNATQLAVEITGTLFYSGDAGIEASSVAIDIEYRLVGGVTWLPFAYGTTTLYREAYWSAGRYETFEDDTDWVQVDYSSGDATEHTEGAPHSTEQVGDDEVENIWRFRPYDEFRGGGISPFPVPISTAHDPAPPEAYQVQTTQITITSASRKPLRLTYAAAVAKGQYELRVRRVTADSTDARAASEIVWSQLRTYQPDTADYSGRKRLALKIKASGQLNGVVSEFNCVASARTRAWDGTQWATVETSNPAWWYLAWGRGKFAASRRVWGGGIADARIDIEALKSFGAWCDSKALTFNGVLDQPQSVFDGLSSIALMGRGTVSWGGGKLSAVWDAPALPVVAVFGMSNIQAGSFSIEYATEQLADELIVNFINPDLDWQRDTLRVAVPGAANPPVRSRPVDLFGCTNKAMAGRNGNLYAANNAYRTRRYKWRSDFEAMPAARGDVVQLSHDLASLDYSGRFIEGGDTTTLKLERTVPLVAGGSFVVIVKPDQTFATYNVTGGAGDTDTLTLTTPLGFNPWADASHPPYDYKWLYGATATPGKKVKIDSIRPLDERTVELTAVDERTEYYASEANSYTYVPPRPVFGGAPSLSALTLTPNGLRAGAGYVVEVVATWETGSDYSMADVRVGVNGGAVELRAQDLRARSFTFMVSDFDVVTVQVTGYGSMGRLGATASIETTQVINFAALLPPSDVPSLRLEGSTFSWEPVADVDAAGYRIRFHYGGRTSWEDASPLHDGLLTQTPHTFAELPLDLVTYLIKAEDAAGIVSVTAAAALADYRLFAPDGDALTANVVETFDFDALGWPGTISGGTITGGDIEADSEQSFYGADDAPRYGADGDSFYAVDTYAALSYESAALAVTGALVGSRMTLDYVLTGAPLYIDYRRTGAGALYGADADSFYGADADAFYDAPEEYLTWPGALISGNDEYQFRLRAGAGAAPGLFENFKVAIDAPDITESFDDIVIAAAGTRLPLTRSYQAIKNVQITLQNDGGAGVRPMIEDKSAALGPLIKVYNAAGSAVQHTVDAVTQGY